MSKGLGASALSRTTYQAIMVVVAHAVISVIHGGAHQKLEIEMSAAANAFIYGVIVAGPFIALGLLLAKRARIGGWLLFLTMAGALLFGAYNHFVVKSPDNVSQVAAGSWGLTFQVTAFLLTAAETLGCWVAVMVIAGARKPRPVESR